MNAHSKGPPSKKVQVFRSSRWTKDHAKKDPVKARSDKKAKRPEFNAPKKACPIQETCQACRFINEDEKESLEIKYQEGLQVLNDLNVLVDTQLTKPQASPRQLEYRTHAKLAVRPYSQCANPERNAGDRRFAIGLFKPQTHQVVDISHCPLHRHSINYFVRDLKAELEASNLLPYDENTQQGDLRYIAVRASHLTEELMVTFVVNHEGIRLELKNLAMKLRQKGHLLNSVYLNLNDQSTNVIFGQENKRLLGSDRLREELCGLSFEIGPTSFFQVNPWQAEVIYRRIEQLAGQESGQGVAWDFYCGIGQISMLLSQAGYRTLGIEENPQAIRDAQKNAIRNELTHQPSFMSGRVEDSLENLPGWAQDPKLIVINPSRKGIAPNVRQYLRDMLREKRDLRLIYLSCEVTTLARDLAELRESGRRVRQLEAYDMFPGTDKMEWLAVID
ncbi:MAG: 23S rRNA (uracil(1939)-C(5))-methyltransferase RlmD [Oligoflexus sp.]